MLEGYGAITQEYIDHLKEKNPRADILKKLPEISPSVQEQWPAELINTQEVVS